MIHQDRRQAESFGEDAERYDRSRPSYPSALIDHLMALQPARVLDVGCGTGKAARLMAARGCDVLGVEPDARMAAVARAHGIAVEVATFEAWDPMDRTFDMVISGQAWHWIDPAIAPKKAASVLPAGGRLALFWNRGQPDSTVKAAMDEVYAKHYRGTAKESRSAHDAPIAASGLFEPPEILSFEWQRRYSRDEWLDQMGTHSDHAILPPAQLAALMEGVAEVIDRFGGSVDTHYQTRLITARKLAGPHQ